MLSLSNIHYGSRLKGLSFTLDGENICIVTDDPSAVCDIISGVCCPTSGEIKREGSVPLLARGCPLPDFMTVKGYFDTVSALSRHDIPDIVYSEGKALLDKRIGSLSRYEKARVGVLSVLIPEAEAVVCECPTEGLDAMEASEVLSLLMSDRHPSNTIFTADSVSDIKMADRVIVIERGQPLYIGTPDGLFEKAHGASALNVRAIGDRSRLEALLDGIDAEISATEKKGVYLITLPESFTSAEVKGMMKGSGVTFIDASRENERIKRIVSGLEHKDEKKTEEREAKEQKASPKKGIDASLFAFNRDTENAFEDDEDADDDGENDTESTLFSGRRE